MQCPDCDGSFARTLYGGFPEKLAFIVAADVGLEQMDSDSRAIYFVACEDPDPVRSGVR